MEWMSKLATTIADYLRDNGWTDWVKEKIGIDLTAENIKSYMEQHVPQQAAAAPATAAPAATPAAEAASRITSTEVTDASKGKAKADFRKITLPVITMASAAPTTTAPAPGGKKG